MRKHTLIELSLLRTFQSAPLLPSSPESTTDLPTEDCYTVGEYGQAMATLAQTLPENCEFYLAESEGVPQWVDQAYQGISTIIGRCNGVVLYRLHGEHEVHARAFIELYNVGSDPCQTYLVRQRGPTFDTSRYLDPESKARHDHVLETAMVVSDETEFESLELEFAGATAYPLR